ncbi:hypothetical protein [Streptomyces sp. NRRL F-5123]|uniref:hypothetical protein n=1 Tax=Streptomyces sp. NRRL F-5123 TaxID=1463856 RepID=UPI0004E267B3|nr:hypothetical protein [Streptomyces sp. NRRL F-5123]
MIIVLPVLLVAAVAAYVSWRMDARMPLAISTVVLGYALATSPLAGGINAFGAGVGNAVHDASNHTQSGTTAPAGYSTTRSR